MEVRPFGDEFADYLSRCRCCCGVYAPSTWRTRALEARVVVTPSTWRRCAGLVASPSPGVVTQALAVGRPCYLVCPTGHLEQKFNQDYYFKYFAGVTNAAASTRAKVRLDGLTG